MKVRLSAVLAGASLFVMASTVPVQAQTTPVSAQPAAANDDLEEIIVTARRKEETLLDVPVTVDVVTADEVHKLDLRDFRDIAAVVPGLSFQGGVALRGVAFNPLVVGTPNVQLYFNDAPVSPTLLTGQSLFDVGQFEVSRGPQGTLRGTSAPSGNVTLTSRLPNLTDIGGYADVTGTSLNLINAQGAIGVPLVQDRLGIRLAFFGQNQDGGGLVESVNNPTQANNRVWGVRGTVLFEPTDNLQAVLTAQTEETHTRGYTQDQVQSYGLVNPAIPLTAPVIRPGQLLSTDTFPTESATALTIFNAHLDWSFLGQQLSYVGAFYRQAPLNGGSHSSTDPANIFKGAPEITTTNSTTQTQWSHEIRLASVQRLFSLFDYTVGGFYSRQPSIALVAEPTIIAANLPTGLTPVSTVFTNVIATNTIKEESVFANVTLHLGDRDEISGGVRHIRASSTSFLGFGTTVLQNNLVRTGTPTIYNATLSHHFNQDLMAYFETGTSFRKGPLAFTNFPIVTPNETAFTNLKDETSKNYELGVKGVFFDKRLSLTLDGYLQNFDNFTYAAGSAVYYANQIIINGQPNFTPATFNFSASVPVQVRGFEASAAAQLTPRLNVNGNIAYAHAYIVNGLVACNPPPPLPPTVAQIIAAANGDHVAACNVNYPTSEVPPWNVSLQGEYGAPLNDRLAGYVRGLLTGQSKNPTDSANPYDKVDAFATVNLYLGIRDPQSSWAVEIYAKNLFDTERVTTFGSAPLNTSYFLLAGRVPTGALATSNYIDAALNAQREFGFHVRYAFGSR